MIITPDCVITTLDKCLPKHVVRNIYYGSDGNFALVSSVLDDDNTRALIHFKEEGPKYEIIKNPQSMKVLRYNQEPIFEIDHFEGFETKPNNVYDINGLIIRNDDTWIMSTASIPWNSPFIDKGYYDMENGSLIAPPNIANNVACFNKWDLYIMDYNVPNAERIKIASFQQQQ